VGVAHLVEDEKGRDSQFVETVAEAIHLDIGGELVE
jgi:hypothetical protein